MISPARRVVLATGNRGKLLEIQAVLQSLGFDVVAQSELGVQPPLEDGVTFAANALIKARHAARLTGLAAIADDSGLEVDALGGRPGVHSARYAGPGASDEANNTLLLAEMAAIAAAERSARYRCAMAFVRHADDAAPLVCEAAWEGHIATAASGTAGFGYDPLFIPAGGVCTAAQLELAQKNRASHRARALRALVAALRDLGR